MLKLSFPLAVKNPIALFEIPYGYTERTCNGEEMPAQRWVDLSGTGENGKRQGLTIITDSKYSYDVLQNDLRLTVLRSPAYADHAGKRDDCLEYMEQGVHEFKYWICPHSGALDKASTVKRAIECNTESVAVLETYHKGNLPLSSSGIHVSAENVVVTVIKRAEEDDGYVMRGYETAGIPVTTDIGLPFLHRKWTTRFGKCEIKTFFLPDNESLPVTERNLIEFSMEETGNRDT